MTKAYAGESVTDITTLNAVESLFHGSKRDPWAHRLAGQFADIYAYSKRFRFVLPDPAPRPTGPHAPEVPEILTQIHTRDSKILRPVRYNTTEKRELIASHLDNALENFSVWAGNSPHLLDWILLHKEPWIAGGHALRVPQRFVYDIDIVRDRPLFAKTADSAKVSVDDLAYAFDVALRYGLYGELAGPTTFYLSHPVREEQNFPTISVEIPKTPALAMSFAYLVTNVAHKLTMDQYTSLLHEIRSFVADKNLDKLKAGVLGKKQMEDIAQELGFPARVKAWAKVAGVATSVIGACTLYPPLAVPAGIGAAVVSIGSLFWKPSVPKKLTKVKWLRPMFKWELDGK